MRNDPSTSKARRTFPATSETLDSGGDAANGGPLHELAALLALAHMRLRQERVLQSQRSPKARKLLVSRSSRQVFLDDVAKSAKLATGDDGISENERSET